MKISCDIIKDLLPLYNDSACSKESANLVEEHLKECPDCTNELSRLKENVPVRMLKLEEKEIIGAYRRNTLKKVLFITVCLLIFPLLNMTFIASYLWFSPKVFIVSALAMLNTVVLPTVIKRNRKVIITASSLIVPVIIFLIFSFRRLFEYDYRNYSEYTILNIMLFAIPSLAYFGLSCAFIPFKIRADHESPMRYKKTALKVMTIETFILIVGVVIATLYTMNEIYDALFDRILYVALLLIFLWVAAFVFRFVKGNKLAKASIYTALVGAFCALYPAIEYFYFHMGSHYYYCFWQADFTAADSQHLIANISMIILIATIVVSLGLFAVGKWGNRMIIPENAYENTTKNIFKNITKKIFKSDTENISENITEKISESEAENTSVNTNESISKVTPRKLPKHHREHFQSDTENTSQNITENISKDKKE